MVDAVEDMTSILIVPNTLVITVPWKYNYKKKRINLATNGVEKRR